ncbi:MAG: branched-chain amino acid transaminase [Ectothiorhodospiraceae bacterium]|nr:branched-chain amino acid transaminase [Chromatiales bacterium]MCP5156305.1 branched-chain amino acid transaminase [Ectothiorhodospiraceae bacterium]
MARAKYVFLNGELVPFDEAKVHVSSAAFKFGTAVFEGLRGYWNEKEEQMYLFRLDDHLARLEFSQRFMRFEEILDPAWIGEKTIELIRANELRETIHIMPTVFVSGFGGPGVCGPIGISIVANPGVSHGFVEKGCTAHVSAWRRPADAAMPMRVKCNANYQNGRLATVQAKADGYDTAILLNDRGKVAEGPGMCFFMVRDGKAVTPTTTSGILESITRATVLELLADRLGVKVEEREIDRSELPAAQEAFFCGTAWEVSPLVAIDRMPVGDGTPGEVTRRLQREFFAIAKGEVADYPHWRTAVY